MPENSMMDDDFPFDDGFPLLIQTQKESFVQRPNEIKKVFHEEIEVKYFYEGGDTLLVGNQAVCVEAGDIVVINPYEFHSTIRLGEHRGKYHLYMVGLDLLNGACPGFNLRDLIAGGHSRFQTLIRDDRRMRELLIRLAQEQAGDAPYRKPVQYGLLMEFFGLLLRNYTESARENSQVEGNIRYYKSIEPAIRRIRNGYPERITTDELAELCCVTKCHFCRTFKNAMGMTASEYLLRYRLRVADILLQNSGVSVAEIAEKCGFNDKNYFSRCYKNSYGVSPRQKRGGQAE